MAHTFNSGTLGGRGSRISEFKDSQNYKRNLVLKTKIMLSIKLPKVVVHVFNLNTGKCEENNCDWYLLHSRKMCSKNMENSITNTPSVVIHADWYGQDGTEVQYGYKDETSIYTTISILKMRLCLPQNCFFLSIWLLYPPDFLVSAKREDKNTKEKYYPFMPMLLITLQIHSSSFTKYMYHQYNCFR